jgi:hypothetical protein
MNYDQVKLVGRMIGISTFPGKGVFSIHDGTGILNGFIWFVQSYSSPYLFFYFKAFCNHNTKRTLIDLKTGWIYVLEQRLIFVR